MKDVALLDINGKLKKIKSHVFFYEGLKHGDPVFRACLNYLLGCTRYQLADDISKDSCEIKEKFRSQLLCTLEYHVGCAMLGCESYTPFGGILTVAWKYFDDVSQDIDSNISQKASGKFSSGESYYNLPFREIALIEVAKPQTVCISSDGRPDPDLFYADSIVSGIVAHVIDIMSPGDEIRQATPHFAIDIVKQAAKLTARK